tara:strand:- start:4550 stop:5125 length:576 start_codon:yes stop_codon:yes gene_type:complete
MKSFIIRLSEFDNSVQWATRAYNSGKHHNWDINYHEGTNGQLVSLEDFNLFANTRFKKGSMRLQRAGVRGCFLSHFSLWKKCIELNVPICILEHDVTIRQPFPTVKFNDILKFATGPQGKPLYMGDWHAGAMAYCVSPNGAKKLIQFVQDHGAMPADVMLCTGIIHLDFYDPIDTVVTYVTDDFSFTEDFR